MSETKENPAVSAGLLALMAGQAEARETRDNLQKWVLEQLRTHLEDGVITPEFLRNAASQAALVCDSMPEGDDKLVVRIAVGLLSAIVTGDDHDCDAALTALRWAMASYATELGRALANCDTQ